jgi:hypothetical protein
MQVQKQVTATNAEMVIELGFIPSKLIITNRTSLATLEWNSNLPAGNFYKIAAAGTRTLVTSGGPTLLDGSDKTNNITSSFGVILPVLADFNDAAEILDIEAIRDDI